MLLEPRRLKRLFYSGLAGLVLPTLLPIYPAHQLIRSSVIGVPGDRITERWRMVQIDDFLDDYPYMRPEDSPQLMLAVNLGIAVVLGLLTAFLVYKLLVRLKLPNP